MDKNFYLVAYFQLCFSALHIYTAINVLIKLDEVTYFTIFCILFAIDALILLIVVGIKKQNLLYWIMYILQLELLYALLKEKIPISFVTSLYLRIIKCIGLIIFQIVFAFGYQIFDVDQIDIKLPICSYAALLLTIFSSAYFGYLYSKAYYKDQNTSLICVQISYFAFYLTICALVAADSRIIGLNIGIAVIVVIFIINTLYYMSNIYLYFDIGISQKSFENFIHSIFQNSYPLNMNSIGEVKYNVITNYLNQLILFIFLVSFCTSKIERNLNTFNDQSIYQQFLLSNTLAAIVFCLIFMVVFLNQFRYYLGYKCICIRNYEDVEDLIDYLANKHFFTTQINIIFLPSYFFQSESIKELKSEVIEVYSEKQSLIEDKCKIQACKVNYQILKGVSFQMKNKVKIILKDFCLTLCQEHSAKIFSNEEFIFPSFSQNTILTCSNALYSIYSRLSKGYLNNEITDKLQYQLNFKDLRNVKTMISQFYSITTFLKHQKQFVSVFPSLILYDLYGELK